MSTTTPTSQESIDAEPTVDPRTRRACEGCMVVVLHGDASGIFDVYSATDGHNEIYTVDLRAETCECGDYEHRQPESGCKHIRRVKLGLGIMPLPAGLDIEIDGALAHDREKYGIDVDAHPPDSSGQEALADGGQLIEPPDDGVILDDDADEEEEKDTDEESEL
jgi:hypothetical protein